MSLLTNVSQVSFASSYSIDKIVGLYTGSFRPNTSDTTTLAGYLYQYAIPHSFTRPVFTELLWSTDDSTYIDGGSGSSVAGDQTIAYSDSSNIYVTTGAASGTIYYKAIASWIDDYDSTNPSITPVITTTQSRFFDSSANYQKTVLSGVITAQPNGASSLDTTIDTSSLPAYANGKLYFESVVGQVWPAIGGGSHDYFLYAPLSQWEGYMFIKQAAVEIVGQTSVSTTTPARFWYRVYGDTQ